MVADWYWESIKQMQLISSDTEGQSLVQSIPTA